MANQRGRHDGIRVGPIGYAAPGVPGSARRAGPHAPNGCLAAAFACFGLFMCCTTPIGCNFIAWLGSDSASGAEAETLCRAFLNTSRIDLPGRLAAPRYHKTAPDGHGDASYFYRFGVPPGEVATFEARVPDAWHVTEAKPHSGGSHAPWWWDVDACEDYVLWREGMNEILLCRRTGTVYMYDFHW